MQPEIDSDGLEAIAAGLHALATRSYVFGPVGYRIGSRILESERRHLAGAFAPRKASTTARYRYPMTSMADGQPHQSAGDGPLDRLGLLRRVLTTPNAPGQRMEIRNPPGGIDVGFGVKARKGVEYIGMQAEGNGGRQPRDPFRFDRIAHEDATTDVLEHIIGDFGSGT